MTIEQAIEAIRKASDDARKVGATEHQIIAAASARKEEKEDVVASVAETEPRISARRVPPH